MMTKEEKARRRRERELQKSIMAIERQQDKLIIKLQERVDTLKQKVAEQMDQIRSLKRELRETKYMAKELQNHSITKRDAALTITSIKRMESELTKDSSKAFSVIRHDRLRQLRKKVGLNPDTQLFA